MMSKRFMISVARDCADRRCDGAANAQGTGMKARFRWSCDVQHSAPAGGAGPRRPTVALRKPSGATAEKGRAVRGCAWQTPRAQRAGETAPGQKS